MCQIKTSNQIVKEKIQGKIQLLSKDELCTFEDFGIFSQIITSISLNENK
jgi:hypothetical protein